MTKLLGEAGRTETMAQPIPGLGIDAQAACGAPFAPAVSNGLATSADGDWSVFFRPNRMQEGLFLGESFLPNRHIGENDGFYPVNRRVAEASLIVEDTFCGFEAKLRRPEIVSKGAREEID